jgi:hypothetical protein
MSARSPDDIVAPGMNFSATSRRGSSHARPAYTAPQPPLASGPVTSNPATRYPIGTSSSAVSAIGPSQVVIVGTTVTRPCRVP